MPCIAIALPWKGYLCLGRAIQAPYLLFALLLMWHREKLSEYKFIGDKRGRPEDFRCESEKVMQLQTTSDNSKSLSPLTDFIV